MDKLISAIKQANKLGERHREAEMVVRVLFEDRYGMDYSDADCDPVIDTVSGESKPFKNLAALDKMVFDYSKLTPNEDA